VLESTFFFKERDLILNDEVDDNKIDNKTNNETEEELSKELDEEFGEELESGEELDYEAEALDKL
ncbi:10174_t:CDS:2, partial [Racocetra fulgida]